MTIVSQKSWIHCTMFLELLYSLEQTLLIASVQSLNIRSLLTDSGRLRTAIGI
jgi:hypothetical protein